MEEDSILIKKGNEKRKVERHGKLYRMMIKSDKMEVIISELDPKTDSKWFRHDGEEMHLVLQGDMEYTVGEKSYKLSEGDILWHKSTRNHRGKNIGRKKVIYITIGTPPTFMISEV
jgi:mannose-6-phosphate isomerase-like protein (cupin superfamily)